MSGYSHCVLQSGDIVGGFEICKRLGSGRFATVWAARSPTDNQEIAIKVFRCGFDNQYYYGREVRMLNKIKQSCQGVKNLVEMKNIFIHVKLDADLNPVLHPCIGFNLGGDSVINLVKYCVKEHQCGIPAKIVKKIMTDLLSGLVHLHAAKIMHCDIKPENLLFDRTIDKINPETMDFNVQIADLGSASPTSKPISYSVGTLPNIAPEVILRIPFGSAVDIWSVSTVCFELLTGELLFDVFKECDILYGSDVSTESVDEVMISEEEISSGTGCCGDDCEHVGHSMDECSEQTLEEKNKCKSTSGSQESNDRCNDEGVGGCSCKSESANLTSSNSDDPSNSSSDSPDEETDYKYMLLIAKVIGLPPKEMVKKCDMFYNADGKLKNHPDMVPITLYDLLRANYDFTEEDCANIAGFLSCGLQYLPDERLDAPTYKLHSWLQI